MNSPGDFEAGSYNVSVQLPMGIAWANPVDTGLFSTAASGTKYEVQYFPTVTDVWPNAGSLAGGTEVRSLSFLYCISMPALDRSL